MSRLAWTTWIVLLAWSARADDFDDFSWNEPRTSVERVPVDVQIDGPDAILSLEIGPNDVGCVVVEQESPPA